MTRLEDATGRLVAAIDRLERALERRLAAESGPGGRAELISALSAAREENVALARTSATVSRRLDGTIERLKAILED